MKALLDPIEKLQVEAAPRDYGNSPLDALLAITEPTEPQNRMEHSSALPDSPARLNRNSLLCATLTGYSVGRLGENRSNSLGYT
jgi:hypothetical protein